MKKITKDKWIWMPHPAHFICAQDCRFFMATKVGDYIISTVGEYFPDAPIREIFAQSRNKPLEGMGDARRADYMKKIGFEELHYGGWLYETMVFKAKESEGCKACAFVIDSGNNLDEEWYKKPEEAVAGHYKMCEKYSKLT